MSRGCPRCAAELQVRTNGGVEVDVCPLCDGIYLDRGEFDQVLTERYGERPAESMFELIGVEVDEPLYCSDCNGAMLRVDYDELELDRCGDCGSVWIDSHEHTDFVDRARAAERDASYDAVVVCSGCGNSELQRLCIHREGAFWCEACVVAGNHPGREAELARIKKMSKAGYAGLTRAQFKQEQGRDMIARRNHKNVSPLYTPGHTSAIDLIETAARKVADLFRRK